MDLKKRKKRSSLAGVKGLGSETFVQNKSSDDVKLLKHAR